MSAPLVSGQTLLSLLLANPPRVLAEQAELHRGQGMDWTADLYELLARDHQALIADLRVGAAVSEIERHGVSILRHGDDGWRVWIGAGRCGPAEKSIVAALHGSSPVAANDLPPQAWQRR